MLNEAEIDFEFFIIKVHIKLSNGSKFLYVSLFTVYYNEWASFSRTEFRAKQQESSMILFNQPSSFTVKRLVKKKLKNIISCTPKDLDILILFMSDDPVLKLLGNESDFYSWNSFFRNGCKCYLSWNSQFCFRLHLKSQPQHLIFRG